MSGYSSRYDRGRYGYDRHAAYDRDARDAGPSRRRAREDDVVAQTQRESRREPPRHGIKSRTFGDAFLGPEQEKYVREQLRSQLATSEGANTPSSSIKAGTSVTPRVVVEEMKRSGHFDQLRKQLLASFQSSPQREELISQLQAFLMSHLAGMSPDKRQRLARKDTRLQHSDLERDLEESGDVAKIFDEMLGKLRAGATSGADPKEIVGDDGVDKYEAALAKNALFAANDGALFTTLQSHLRETIETEKHRAAEAAAAESTHKPDSQQADVGATPLAPGSTRVDVGSGAATEAHTQSQSGESDAGSATPHVKFSTASTPLRHEITGGP